MIITLKGVSFASSNIGTLDTWRVSPILGNGATYSGDYYVDRDAALNATVTIADGYELVGDVVVMMGGVALASGVTTTGNTTTISIPSVTGNITIKVSTKNIATVDPTPTPDPELPEEPDPTPDPEVPSATTLTLYQGYANESKIDTLATRVRTDFIEGPFSVTCNSGYVIRAIYEYAAPAAASGKAIVAASDNKTSYEYTGNKYCIITFCKTDANANVLPSENIVASFTGTVYVAPEAPPSSGSTTVDGIRLSMGQILGNSLKTDHTGRAYTVDTVNHLTTASTEGSDFVMIPVCDSDNNLNNGSTTMYTKSDGSFALSSAGGATLKYHSTINIADMKAVAPDQNLYIMFKHNTATSFNLADLAAAVSFT